MDFALIVIGKTSTNWVKTAIEEYLQRLKHYVKFELIEIPDLKNVRSLSREQQKCAEGDLLLARLQTSDFVMLLDERGKQYRSIEFANMIERKMASGLRRLVFVVGGPFGFSPAVYDRADGKLSLSAMTFSHEMIRAFFVEQVYRALTILRGEKYHHE